MSSDSWLTEYDNCICLTQEILRKINERNKHNRTSNQYTKLSAEVRVSMKQFSSDAQRLRQNLIRASSSYHITQREVERRQIMMDNLTTKEKQIDQAFKNQGGESRYNLIGSGGGGISQSNDPWGVREEPDELRGFTNSQIRDQQQQIIQEQDQGLEALSGVISRQKQIALDIGNEVDDQNVLIDDITDHVGKTDDRIKRETRHIKIVDRKSATCCYWVVIVLLFVVIIVVVAIPKSVTKHN
ncbi:hypothetical protein ACJMK2_033480 [Sinanodonta woodiana]|uniref:Syntaxin-8 n=1 Tax=Sinanodonta woodiana TaxID=1069815 RepID=A0ABD3WPY8_SINWO